MTNQLPKVSVVVLSHDRPAFLAQALDSIVSQSHQNLEVIVVDNRSDSSDAIEKLVRQYQNVRLIRNRSNLGFTGGINVGIEAATGEYLHCTVDDVILDPQFIERLSTYMSQHPFDGLLSGVLYNQDRKTIRVAGGEFALDPIYKQTHFASGKEKVEESAPFNVKFIPGGFLFSKLETMRRLKGFRKDFFMYSEDVELCARVLASGNQIRVLPEARAWVLDAPHAFTPVAISFHKTKNLLALYLLHAPMRVLPEFFLRYGVLNPARSVMSNGRMTGPVLKAWGWFLFKTPSLLAERLRNRKFISTRS